MSLPVILPTEKTTQFFIEKSKMQTPLKSGCSEKNKSFFFQFSNTKASGNAKLPSELPASTDRLLPNRKNNNDSKTVRKQRKKNNSRLHGIKFRTP